MRIKALFFLLFLVFSFLSNAQSSCDGNHQSSKSQSLEFIPNENQFHPNVHFEASIGGLDKVFLEKNAFTYIVHEDKAVQALHDVLLTQNKDAIANHSIAGHSYKVKFLNSLTSTIQGDSKQSHYYNYFLGNEPSKWASKVPVFHQTKYESLYSGIDLVAYSHNGYLKYDFVIAPHTDIKELALEYEGVNGVRIDRNGDLIIETSVKEIVEKAPIAYQVIDGEPIYIDCNYKLNNRTLTFELPNGYNKNHTLIIDPEVIASTLSGTSFSKNFGHTASYDNAGNIYLGGVSFGVGYPTDSGSFQESYGGGFRDMAVCKFNEDGTNMFYATYIGGEDSDYPHSLIVDNNQQLCIYGTTKSSNFPVTANAYQPTRKGGGDIAVVKLNQDGSALVGSTYLGGSSYDGSTQYRGEIILDQQGNILIAANTTSTDFPTTPNAYQNNLNFSPTTFESQDGIICKFNSDLSTLFWSTYLGGEGEDTALGIRINDEGEICVTGTAGSADFPTTAGTVQSAWPGGQESAYVAVLSSNGQQVLRSTFWGTDKDDNSYFLDLDESGNVHIYGQTTGVMPISTGAYFYNQGSPQFLAAFTSDLKTLVYSTVIGNGPPPPPPPFLPSNVEYDFRPAAFMVDKCNGIYFSGYYADPGLPTTFDAIPGSLGDAFYLGVLEPNASGLQFATYYGNANHVDGGTSRFDKGGVVYQAVCSCSSSLLTTKDGAWAENQTTNCDMGVFKIDFEISTVTAQVSFDQSGSGCAPYTIDFNYTGQDGANYLWDFGTGNTSAEENPSHTFLEPGSYTVMLVAENVNTCNLRDTSYAQIDILDGTDSTIDTSLCNGSNILFLDATVQNAAYNWQDGSTGATLEVDSPGLYWVDISIAGCSRRDTFNVHNTALSGNFLEDDIRLCGESNYLIEVNNPAFNSFQWSDNSTESSLLANTDGTYYVTVTNQYGCELTDNVNVSFAPAPDVDLGDDHYLCAGQSVVLQSSITEGDFMWQDNSTDDQFMTNTPGIYSLEVTVDDCTAQDEVEIFLAPELVIDLGPDLLLCDQESLILDGSTPGANMYAWTGAHIDPIIEITSSGLYELSIVDDYGCEFKEEIRIDLVDSPEIDLRDSLICEGQTILLNVSDVADSYLWDNGDIGSSITVSESGQYWVEAVNQGCISRDTANIIVNPIPVLDLGMDQVICDELFLTLDATLNGASYEWQDGSNNSTFEVSDPGTYSVVIELDGCSNTDMIAITPSVELNIDLGEDEILCDVASVELDVQNSLITNYKWNSGELISNINPNQDGVYWVEVIDIDGCIHRDSIELRFIESPIIDLKDTILCIGEEVALNAFSQNATYTWNDDSTDEILIAKIDGEYWVEAAIQGCISRDTAIIKYAIAPDYSVDQKDVSCFSHCDGSLDFINNSADDNLTILWSNNEIQSLITSLCPDDYELILTDQYGCEYLDTYNISEPDDLSYEVQLQDVECADFMNGSISIGNVNGAIEPYSISFNGSDFGNKFEFENLSGGQFFVEIKDGNACLFRDSFEINEPEQIIIDAGEDGFIELGEVFQMNANTSENSNLLIEWNNQDDLSCIDCLDPLASPIQTTTYELVATNTITGCRASDDMIIDVSQLVRVHAPNIFSPNGDGSNDRFTIYANGTVVKINYLNIFDRWGGLIFEKENFMANDVDAGWDGTMNNQNINPGVFVYVVELELFDGQKEIVKGDITLVR